VNAAYLNEQYKPVKPAGIVHVVDLKRIATTRPVGKLHLVPHLLATDPRSLRARYGSHVVGVVIISGTGLSPKPRTYARALWVLGYQLHSKLLCAVLRTALRKRKVDGTDDRLSHAGVHPIHNGAAIGQCKP
jgi:hypothetical protein